MTVYLNRFNPRSLSFLLLSVPIHRTCFIKHNIHRSNTLTNVRTVSSTQNHLFDSVPPPVSPPVSLSWRLSPLWENYLPNFIMNVHDVSTLSMGWTLVLCTLGVRLMLVPVTVISMRYGLIASRSLRQYAPYMKQLKQLYLLSNDRNKHKLFIQGYVAFVKKARLNPFKLFASPLLHLPIFMTMIWTVKHMANEASAGKILFNSNDNIMSTSSIENILTNSTIIQNESLVDAMVTGGTAWFTDLSIMDPYWILPATSAFLMLLNIELSFGVLSLDSMNRRALQREASSSTATSSLPASKLSPATLFGIPMEIVCRSLQTMVILMIPTMCRLPAACALYFCCSNSFTLGQTLLLRQPDVRNALGISANPRMPDRTSSTTIDANVSKASTTSSVSSSKLSSIESTPHLAQFIPPATDVNHIAILLRDIKVNPTASSSERQLLLEQAQEQLDRSFFSGKLINEYDVAWDGNTIAIRSKDWETKQNNAREAGKRIAVTSKS